MQAQIMEWFKLSNFYSDKYENGVDYNSNHKSNNNKSCSGYDDSITVFIVLAVTGPIAGSVVGILILLFLIGGVIFFIRRWVSTSTVTTGCSH